MPEINSHKPFPYLADPEGMICRADPYAVPCCLPRLSNWLVLTAILGGTVSAFDTRGS